MDPEPINLLLIESIIFNGTVVFYAIMLIILLICSALISGSEVAFFSLSQTDLQNASESKSKNELRVVKLLEDPKKLLATILISNNFINILAVLIFAFLGEFFFKNISPAIFKFLIEVVLVTFLILMFGEVLPKVYATRNALKFAKFMAIPLQFLNSFLTFLSTPLLFLNNTIETKLGNKKTKLSVEKLSKALELTSENATTEDEQKILEGIVNFGNTETSQIMTPRIDIFALSEDESYDKVISKIIKNGFSRIPVYKENIDNIIGVLYAKDLLAHIKKKTFKWQQIIREPFYVPENKKLDDLLKEFQEIKNHLAIVVDEYGGTSGIVTLEDIIEEIVGDINDEFDDDDITYSKIDAKNYIFEGKINIKDFCKILDLEEEDFEDAKGESETLAGLVLELSGRFPKKNETIKFNGIKFKMESLDKRRIKQIKVTIL